MRVHFVCLLLLAGTFALVGTNAAAAEEWRGGIEQHVRRLRDLVRQDEGPTEIYALVTDATACAVQATGSATLLRCEDPYGRIRDRDVSADEFKELKQWLTANKVDELPPFDEGTFDGMTYEYVHLNRAGTERRVHMNNPPGFMGAPAVTLGSSTPAPKRELYGELTKRLSDLTKVSMRVRYPLLEQLPGFRIVHTYEKGDATKLSFRDGKLLALLRNEDGELTWHEVTPEGITSKVITVSPAPLDRAFDPDRSCDYADASEGPYAGKRVWAETAVGGKVQGLWAAGVKGEPELIVHGEFVRPIISPDGDRLVAAKATEGGWTVPNTVVRVHLPTKQLTPVELPPADTFQPIAWLRSHGRFLLFREPNKEVVGEDSRPPREYYLFDPVTGDCQRLSRASSARSPTTTICPGSLNPPLNPTSVGRRS